MAMVAITIIMIAKRRKTSQIGDIFSDWHQESSHKAKVQQFSIIKQFSKTFFFLTKMSFIKNSCIKPDRSSIILPIYILTETLNRFFRNFKKTSRLTNMLSKNIRRISPNMLQAELYH